MGKEWSGSILEVERAGTLSADQNHRTIFHLRKVQHAYNNNEKKI